MISRLTLAAVLCFAAAVARAETVEVALPGLEGIYNFQNSREGDGTGIQKRQVSFDLGGHVTQVNGASIRWVGAIRTDYYPFQIGAGIFTRLGPPNTDGWSARVLFEKISFDKISSDGGRREFHFELTTPLRGPFYNPNPDWEFLYDGVADIELGLYQILYSTSTSFTPPSMDIHEATLMLDVTFAVTPVEPSTWGRVKALYR